MSHQARECALQMAGMILAALILCCTAAGQEIAVPHKETAGDSYICQNQAGSAGCENSRTGRAFPLPGADFSIALPAGNVKESFLGKELLPSAAETEIGSEELPAAPILPTVPELPDIHEVPDIPAAPEAPGDTIAPAEPKEESPMDPDPSEGQIEFVSYSGFLCDASGMIVSCEGVQILDGLLVLPTQEGCKGIAAGALAPLGEIMEEIYIPQNIVSIQAGAFDGLWEYVYIQVHPDNPAYGSSQGCIYEK